MVFQDFFTFWEYNPKRCDKESDAKKNDVKNSDAKEIFEKAELES